MQNPGSVPKFSSFKPKRLPEKFKDEHRQEATKVEAEEKHRLVDRGRAPPSTEHRRCRQKQHDSPHREGGKASISGRDSELLDAAAERDLYLDDRKGDAHNLTYGTIHRYSIPSYYRIGRGNVLGLATAYKIDREYNTDSALLIHNDGSAGDSKRNGPRSLLSRTEPAYKQFRLRRDARANDSSSTADFLPLESHQSRKRRRLSSSLSHHELSDFELEKTAYRSILGKAKPEDDVPSDLESVSSYEGNGHDGSVRWESSAQTTNAELFKEVENHSQDVGAWLRLIEHQNTLVAGPESRRQLTLAERQSLADIKLSVYEKALKQVGEHPLKHRLVLGYLEEGAKIWEQETQFKKWQSMLKAYPDMIILWVKYLDVLQTDFSKFTFAQSKSTFYDVMKLNSTISSGTAKDSIQTYIFLRMTLLVREAGFTEMAVGLWQAALEFTLFCPSSLQSASEDSKISAFREFWESEVARIGEPGANGWRAEADTFPPSSTPFPVKTKFGLRKLFESWSQVEKDRCKFAHLPARTLDEVEDDDPYRVVLFSDIQDFVQLMAKWTSVEILVLGFLCFCGLPPLMGSELSGSVRFWQGDPFLRNAFSTTRDAFMDHGTRKDGLETGPVDRLFENVLLPNDRPTIDTIFTHSSEWFSSLKLWRDWIFGDSSALNPDWVRRALQLLVESDITDDAFAEYAIAVTFSCDATNAKKYAKSLLKKRSSSLRLYNAYATIEARVGNTITAAHVWSTTLSMYSQLSQRDRLGYGLLWRTWIWVNLKRHEIGQVIYLLSSIPNFAVDVNTLSQPLTRRTLQAAEFLKTQKVS
jgi:hypothetical protein